MLKVRFLTPSARLQQRRELNKDGNSTISRLCLECKHNRCGYLGCCCICHEDMESVARERNQRRNASSWMPNLRVRGPKT